MGESGPQAGEGGRSSLMSLWSQQALIGSLAPASAAPVRIPALRLRRPPVARPVQVADGGGGILR